MHEARNYEIIENSMQIMTHSSIFSHQLVNWPKVNTFNTKLSETIFSYSETKKTVKEEFYYDLKGIFSYDNTFNQLFEYTNPNEILENFLFFLHEKLSSDIKRLNTNNQCVCPVCEIFFPEGVSLTNERNFKFLYRSEDLANWIAIRNKMKLSLKNNLTPLILVIKIPEKLSEFRWIVDIAYQDFKIEEHNDDDSIFQLFYITFESKGNEKRIISFRFDDKKWISLTDSVESSSIYSEDFNRNYTPSFLFFEKKPNQSKYNQTSSFIFHLFFNFFYIDDFFTYIQKPQFKSLWSNILIETFQVTEQHSDMSIKVSFWANLITEYFKISKSVKISNQNETFFDSLFSEAIRETNQDNMEKNFSLCFVCFDHNRNQYFIELDLENDNSQRDIIYKTLKATRIDKNYFIIKNNNTRPIFDTLYKIDNIKITEDNSESDFKIQSIIFKNDHSMISLIFCKGNETNWGVFEWGVVENLEPIKRSQNFAEAILWLKNNRANYVPYLIFYRRQFSQNVGLIGPEGIKATEPIRLVNFGDDTLCIINSAIQALFNIPSFKLDICKWTASTEWGKEIVKIFRDEVYSDRKIIPNLQKFRESFKKSNEIDKENPSSFLNIFLKEIHPDDSDCVKPCLFCKNFKIKGSIQIIDNFGNITDREIDSFQIYQPMRNPIIDLSQEDKMLSFFYDYKIYYNLESVPRVLFIQLTELKNGSVIKAKEISDYLEKNETINYKKDEIVYTYRLKSIILLGSKRYKSLLFSRTHGKWMLVSDSNIEPVYLNLKDFNFQLEEFTPSSLLYYNVPQESLIEDYLKGIFSILPTVPGFNENIDKIQYKLNGLNTFANYYLTYQDNPENFREFSNLIKTINFKGEVLTPLDVLTNILKILHEDDRNNTEKSRCKCVACKNFVPKFNFIPYNTFHQNFTNLEDYDSVYDLCNYKEKKLNELKIIKIEGERINNETQMQYQQISMLPKFLILRKNIEFDKTSVLLSNFINENQRLEIGKCIYELRNMVFQSKKSLKIRTYTFDGVSLTTSLEKGDQEFDSDDFELIFVTYCKIELNYLKVALKLLSECESFANDIFDFQEVWLISLINILKNDLIEDNNCLMTFKNEFNSVSREKIGDIEKYNYKIQTTLRIILSRIHEMYHPQGKCPICSNFTIRGYFLTEENKENLKFKEINTLFIKTLVTNKNISENVLSHYEKGDSSLDVLYFLPEPPKILFYTLKINSSQRSNEEINKIFNSYLEKNQKFTYRNNDNKEFQYRLVNIICQIHNNKDSFHFCSDTNQINGWNLRHFDYDEMNISPPEIQQIRFENFMEIITERSSGKNIYFPSLLVYFRD